MSVFTTEIASDTIVSDNPVHQRLLFPYHEAKGYIRGDLLEIGCGEGRGVDLLAPLAGSYTALDKIETVIESLSAKYKAHHNYKFIATNIPPFNDLKDNSFDTIVSFQVIEHIKDDKKYLQEIYRVLKPGGKALITTPNIKKTLSRNPWHEREYTAQQLTDLACTVFPLVEMKGVTGNKKVWDYYNQNKKSVDNIMKWDFLNLQYKLPASLLRIPYEILNRINRNKLQNTNSSLVSDIVYTDYLVTNEADDALDLFLIVAK